MQLRGHCSLDCLLGLGEKGRRVYREGMMEIFAEETSGLGEDECVARRCRVEEMAAREG